MVVLESLARMTKWIVDFQWFTTLLRSVAGVLLSVVVIIQEAGWVGARLVYCCEFHVESFALRY